ncbi:NAD(P)-dependent oxidoreductase [Erythrobacter sp. THAF29]|uniref:NAD-dependent epimerase/dehydratase family protein n=1 Tax=Erythrobacter sp. THAF29 TaxID=2587851 RepID=UPI001267E170|nr:NAD(P)-dependent oxidoreductase [Erythrobacter sp. THAF29]QFT77085.1 3 beta-hydroxysteroid dehydrogenase/Delta 5-->4-isomerase [Erythrobacter sp. THAF29]
MKLAITGATGFVGSSTLDAALQKGHSVRALARSPQPPRDRVEWVRGTLEDTAALRSLAEGTDAVIHIAGLTNTPDPDRFEAANVTGTANVIEAMKSSGVERLVFVSSLSAREPSLSQYGASKARAEALVEASGLDWTIVRPPAVYGPHDTDMFELFRAAKLGLVPVPPGGKTSIIHVEDLARLLVALAEPNPATRHQIYEPWDDNAFGYEHSELAKMIAEAVGNSFAITARLPAPVMQLAAKADRAIRGPKAKLTADRVGYMLHPDWVCDMKKAPPISVWQAVWSGEEGLKHTADWYKEQGWL